MIIISNITDMKHKVFIRLCDDYKYAYTIYPPIKLISLSLSHIKSRTVRHIL